MEAPPVKTLLVLGCFLGIFTVLSLTIPSAMLGSTELEERRTIQYPDYFDVSEVESFVEWWEYRLNGSDAEEIYVYFTDPPYNIFYETDIDIGGRNINFVYIPPTNDSVFEYSGYYQNYFYCAIRYPYQWILNFPRWNRHQWYDLNGVDLGTWLDQDELNTRKDDMSFITETQGTNPYYNLHVEFGYDETTYNSPEHAWRCNNLYILVAIDFDDLKTGINAYELLTGVLFFDMPNVPFVIQSMISIPLWICIAWITLAFVIAIVKSLPFT